jgi:hypothetical protein
MGRRIFSVGRRGVLAGIAAVCLLAPAVASAAPTPDQAAAELNVWRTEIGEPLVAASTALALDTGCAHHDNYEDANGDVLTHTEGGNGTTPDGTQAGLDSVLAETGASAPDASLLPGPLWDSGVFHRAALLEPRLALTGFNATAFPADGVTFACMWVQNQSAQESPQVIDNSRTTPTLTLYPSPANGAYDVPTRFPAGSEAPDPAQETGVPAGATLGWLLNVEINGPWSNGEFGFFVFAHGVTATLAPDGTTDDVPVVISQCGPSGCGATGGTSEGNFFDGGFGIFPTEPLAANTTYRVVLTGGTVTDSSAHMDYAIPVGFSWCFSTGATYTVSADCAAPTTGAEEVAHPNASTAVSLTPPPPAPPTSGAPPTGTGTPPGTGTGTPPGTGTPTGTGRGSGTPTSGAAAHHRHAPRPGAKGTLRGVRHGHPRLVLRLRAARGGAAIRRFAVTLPHGMSFARHAASLRSGVRVTAGHHRARVRLRRHHRVLTITLRHRARSVVLSVRRPALRVSRLLVRAARARHPSRLRFSIALTAGAATTHRRLRLAPH